MTNTNSPDPKKTLPMANVPQVKGVKYTLDGEMLVLTNNQEVSVPIPKSLTLPSTFRAQHAEAMYKIGMFIAAIKRHAPKRQLPALRAEVLEYGVSKKILGELEKMGFVAQRVIGVLDTNNNNKPTGARSIVYFTPAGKAFFAPRPKPQEVKDGRKPEGSSGAAGDSGPVQSEVRPVDEGARS